MRSRLRNVLGLTALLVLAVPPGASTSAERRLDGFNVVVSARHPYGSTSAEKSLALAKAAGATAVAIVPFLWQSSPNSDRIVRGTDMDDDQLRNAIRATRKLGLISIIKPHVWVEGSWAGAIAVDSEKNWQTWFRRYTVAIAHIARIASEEQADILCIGTELARTTARPEWENVIKVARAAFPGELTYAAHNIEEAEAVPFWNRLDTIAVTLYPPLGVDGDGAHRLAIMRSTADRLDDLAARTGKRVVVGEIGIRSAQGAAAKPWESPEEREAMADPSLQAAVLGDWLKILDRPSVRGILIWRWFTDPDAGGIADTDFTVQGKPAETVIRCAWMLRCDR